MGIRHKGWAALALVAPLALWSCNRKDDHGDAKTVARADQSRPNIVLISVDTLRPDHLGCYGYDRKTSPRIDQLAAEGALFENTISSTSWTLPAHAALFTGLVDSVHGCLDMDQRLADSRMTLAERLKAVGYRTVGFFSGPPLHPAFGLAQGFDEYTDCTSYADMTTEVATSGQNLDHSPVWRAANADITNPTVYQQVRTWLKGNDRLPFFMFVHMWDPHHDYIPPPPYDQMFDPDYAGSVTAERFLKSESINPSMPKRDLEHVIALYDGEIAWTDYYIGMMLDDLEAWKLRDSTIVLLLSDHGDEFFEHGGKGHRATLYDEVIRIPLIIRYPGHISPGQRFSAQARLIDVLPTILELAGLPAAKDVMGHSLVPLFSSGRLRGDTLAISELFSIGHKLRSFRRPQRKLIYNERTRAAAVYDLLTDPGEHAPLRDADAPLVQMMLQDARVGNKWLGDYRRILATASTSAPQLPENVRRQLESLGYLGPASEQGEEAENGKPP